jgi:ElaB/YqjD/DUF883 family membrane-anchored ribosome-binding protein
MSNSTKSESNDLDVIVKDVAALKSDISKLMGHVKDGAAETVSHETRRLYDSLTAEGERSAAALARQVEDRPFASLLIAFAVGFVGGQILRR